MRHRHLLALPLLLLTACAPQVLTQPVPVSTDPGGVNLSVDGKPACVTPCKVDLERNQDHILTLTREGYRQKDVLIKRQYLTNKVMLNAINEGVRNGNFFKDASWGVGGGVQSINRQEETGEAYVLVPSTVSVRMMPQGGFPVAPVAMPTSSPSQSSPSGQQVQPQAQVQTPAQGNVVSMGSLLASMTPGDEQMLENSLEGSRSGEPTVWTNPETRLAYSMVPEPATIKASGEVVRWFTLAVRQGGQTSTAHAPAQRVGRGEWAVAGQGLQQRAAGSDEAATLGQTPPPGSEAEDISRQETMRALGQTTVPSATKSWDVGSSGSTKSSTSYGADGSRTTTTTSTKTSAKVSANVSPGSVVSAVGALQGLFGE